MARDSARAERPPMATAAMQEEPSVPAPEAQEEVPPFEPTGGEESAAKSEAPSAEAAAPAPVSWTADSPLEAAPRAVAVPQPPPPATAAPVDLNTAAPPSSSPAPQVDPSMRAPPIRTPEQALLAMGGSPLPHHPHHSLQLVLAATTNSLSVAEKKRPHQGPRTALTLAQKRAICEQSKREPDMKQEDLAQWAVREFGLRSLARNTVANVLKDEQRWNTSVAYGYSGAKRIRPGAHPELETALKLYVNSKALVNEPVKLVDLREKARELAIKMGISNFKWSVGWLDRMRKRQKILVSVRRQRNEELEQPDLRLAQQLVIEAARQLHIQPSDVYNFDETGLLYKAQPSKADIAPGPDGSRPPGMDRITVAFICNSEGTEILKPLVVGPPNRPGSFGAAFDPSKHVHYFSGPDARMTSGIFNTWLQTLDARMQQRQRRVAIIVDNAACHRVTILGSVELGLGPLKGVQLPSGAVTLIYLPPSALPSWQPLEKGVVRCFKTRYRRRLMEWTLARWERRRAHARPGGLTALTQFSTPPGSQLVPGPGQGAAPGSAAEREELQGIRPSLRDAVTWTGIIWVEMDEDLIVGSWKRSGMVEMEDKEGGEQQLEGENGEPEALEDRVAADVQMEVDELKPLMEHMGVEPGDLLEPDQYVALPGEVIHGPLNDDELLLEVGFVAPSPCVPALEGPPGGEPTGTPTGTPAAEGEQRAGGDAAMEEAGGAVQGEEGGEASQGVVAQTPSQATPGASSSQAPSEAQTPGRTPGRGGYGMGAAQEAEGSGEVLPVSLLEAEQVSARLLAFVEENGALFEEATLKEMCGVNRAFQRAIVSSMLYKTSKQNTSTPEK